MEWQGEGRRGTRPSAPQGQRTASTYIFGAICPKEGKGASLVLPWCNIEAMALHLQRSRRKSHRAGMQPSCSTRLDGTSQPSS